MSLILCHVARYRAMACFMRVAVDAGVAPFAVLSTYLKGLVNLDLVPLFTVGKRETVCAPFEAVVLDDRSTTRLEFLRPAATPTSTPTAADAGTDVDELPNLPSTCQRTVRVERRLR